MSNIEKMSHNLSLRQCGKFNVMTLYNFFSLDCRKFSRTLFARHYHFCAGHNCASWSFKCAYRTANNWMNQVEWQIIEHETQIQCWFASIGIIVVLLRLCQLMEFPSNKRFEWAQSSHLLPFIVRHEVDRRRYNAIAYVFKRFICLCERNIDRKK